MKRQLFRFNYFNSQTDFIPPLRLVIYFTLFTIVLGTGLFGKIANSGLSTYFHIDKWLLTYLLYFSFFLYILPKYYLNYHFNFAAKTQIIFFTILLGYFGVTLLLDQTLNVPSNLQILTQNYSDNILFSKVTTIVIIGFVEEFIFRVILFRQLVIHTSKTKLSIFLSSIAFALSHLPRYLSIHGDYSNLIWQLLLVFITSLVLADIYFVSSSLVLVAFLHAFLDIKPFLFANISFNAIYDYSALLMLLTLPIILRIMPLRAESPTANSVCN